MDTIHVARSDGKAISHNRSAAGAAGAVADEVQERMTRLGSGQAPIDATERAAIIDIVVAFGHLDLNLRSGTTLEMPGLSRDRIHAIAFNVGREYHIDEVLLGD